MLDPRLVEIDFLMDLERSEELTVVCDLVVERSGALKRSDVHRYGLDPDRFRAMLLDIILKEYAVGPDRRSLRPSNGLDEERFQRQRRQLTRDLFDAKELRLHLSHAGRLHLWTQRDALLRDPDIEPFGLRSRAAWDRDLFVRLRWAAANAPLSLIFLDLDNFGMVNKEHGAPVGDAVLRLVFSLISNVVGTRGAAYRYGGEEVGVLLPGVALEKARDIAEELRALIEKDVHAQVTKLAHPQTASLGVASFVEPLENDAAVAVVDDLMRAAKQGGKNRVQS